MDTYEEDENELFFEVAVDDAGRDAIRAVGRENALKRWYDKQLLLLKQLSDFFEK